MNIEGVVRFFHGCQIGLLGLIRFADLPVKTGKGKLDPDVVGKELARLLQGCLCPVNFFILLLQGGKHDVGGGIVRELVYHPVDDLGSLVPSLPGPVKAIQ